MTEITFEDIETEVRRLVCKSPDFKYERSRDYGCFYNPTVRNGKQYGSCLFGQAFINLGEPVPVGCDGDYIGSVFEDMNIDVTEEQRDWAYRAQLKQDEGMPWREALAEADAAYPLT